MQIRLTCLDAAFAPLLEHARQSLAELPEVEVLDDPDRASGRGYYTGLCFKLHAVVGGAVVGDEHVELGDGGFVTWTQQLIGNRKERLLITGIGVDRLAVRQG